MTGAEKCVGIDRAPSPEGGDEGGVVGGSGLSTFNVRYHAFVCSAYSHTRSSTRTEPAKVRKEAAPHFFLHKRCVSVVPGMYLLIMHIQTRRCVRLQIKQRKV